MIIGHPELGNIRDYILKYFPETLWWNGLRKHEKFKSDTGYKHRQGLPNEIRIEFDYDDRNKNWDAVYETCFNLTNLKYSYGVYETEGGRGPHIHIYDLDELEQLDLEQRKIYRELFLEKICGNFEPDKALCDEKHLCALEFANHFKYNKPKRLIAYIDNGVNQGIEIDIKLEVFYNTKKYTIKKRVRRDMKFGEFLVLSSYDKIIKNCSFEAVFDKYGINYKGTMALCPFHTDGDNSLSFSNDKGLWKCFGCEAKGNVFTLIKMLRELKNGN